MIATTLLTSILLAAPGIRYAVATSHVGAHGQSSKYGAPALFDGDDTTAWCEGARGQGEGERVGLELTEPAVIDRIRIAAGSPVEFGRFVPANRPRAISITNLRYEWQVMLPNDGTPFELPLPPPLRGEQIVVRIDSVHDHHARHTCLAELTFFQGGEPLRLVPVAKGVQPGGDAPSFEGVWAPVPSREPEHFLVFYRDGRYFRRLEPLSSRATLARGGTWRSSASRLTLDGDAGSEAADVKWSVDAETGAPILVLAGAQGGVWRPWVPDPLPLGPTPSAPPAPAPDVRRLLPTLTPESAANTLR